MGNEIESLGDRKGDDGHLAKKFLKKDCSELSWLPCRDLAVVTRRQLAISASFSKRSFFKTLTNLSSTRIFKLEP